jgi:hypothetical protein
MSSLTGFDYYVVGSGDGGTDSEVELERAEGRGSSGREMVSKQAVMGCVQGTPPSNQAAGLFGL